jgi:hypothetical protein
MTAQEPTPRPGTDADWVVKLLAVMRRLDPGAGVRARTELEEVLRYFRTTVPERFDIRAGALFRKRSGGAWLVAQCFLTTADELACDSSGLPSARIFRTLAFDNGLTDLFGDKDLIVFT